MNPVKLGDLPSNKPVPTGLCQIKRGAYNGGVNYNNTVAQGSLVHDGTGAPMRIAITPDNPGWWCIRAEGIWMQADGDWCYFTWYVGLSPADVDGVSNFWSHMSQHPAINWQMSKIDGIYRLNAGIAYTATIFWGYSSGYNQQIFTGPDYFYISGEFVGEGQI